MNYFGIDPTKNEFKPIKRRTGGPKKNSIYIKKKLDPLSIIPEEINIPPIKTIDIELQHALSDQAEAEYKKQGCVDQPPLPKYDHSPESYNQYKKLPYKSSDIPVTISSDVIAVDFTALMRMKNGKVPAKYSGSITATLNNISESFC